MDRGANGISRDKLTTILIFLSLWISSTGHGEEMIGEIHPPMPAGYELNDLGVFPDEDPDSGLVHTLSHVSSPKGDFVWLNRRQDQPGQDSKWRIVGSMAVPPLTGDRVLVFLLCLIDGSHDPEVIAIVDYDADSQMLTSHAAWRADRRGQRFTMISPRGVTCVNESHGL